MREVSSVRGGKTPLLPRFSHLENRTAPNLDNALSIWDDLLRNSARTDRKEKPRCVPPPLVQWLLKHLAPNSRSAGSGPKYARLGFDTLEARIVPSNNAPEGASNTINLNEDAVYQFQTSDFGFSDPNDSPANNFHAIKVVTLPSAGLLTNNGNAVSANDFISVADIAAGYLAFAPAANGNGSAYATFDFQVQDDGGTANGGIDLDPTARSMTMNVAAVNDAPTVNVPTSRTIVENTPIVFSTANSNAISIADVDAGTSELEVTLMAMNGGITLSQTTGLTFTTGDGTNDVAMTFTGTLANINAALQGMSYTPQEDYYGGTWISVGVSDQGNTGSGGAQSQSRMLTINVLPSAETLYAQYLDAVADADADYAEAVLAAADARDAAIALARAGAEQAADSAYADYEATVASAQTTYDAAIADADADYQAALADADAAWATATDAALDDYDTAMAAALADYNATLAALDAAYDDALADADAAYDAYVAPYQDARDDAYDAWQADPQNTTLEAAYQQAQSDLDTAITTATSVRDAAYADALDDLEAGQDDAEVALVAAQDEALADYDVALGDADDAWILAEQEAQDAYLDDESDANDAFWAAKASAWSDHVAALAVIDADLTDAESAIVDTFDAAVATALTAWQADESDAWDAYTTGLAALPDNPAPDDQVENPADPNAPAIDPFSGFVAKANLDELNERYGQINTALNNLDTPIGTAGGLVDSLPGIRTHIQTATDPVDRYYAVNDYLDIMSQLKTVVAQIYADATVILLDRIHNAVTLTEGMAFRMEGIRVQIRDLDNKLKALASQIESERSQLQSFIDPDRQPRVAMDPTERMALHNSGRRLAALSDGLNAFVERRVQAVLDAEPAAAMGGILAQLNAYFGDLVEAFNAASGHDDVLQDNSWEMMIEEQYLSLASAPTDWNTYILLTSNDTFHAASLWGLIGANNGVDELADGTAYALADEATAILELEFGANGDPYARDGIRAVVSMFDTLLVNAIADLQEHIDWIERLRTPEGADFEDFLHAQEAHENLVDAITDWLMDALNWSPNA